MNFCSALEPMADILSAMLESNTLPHALLLEGASEALRKDAAVALARILLCDQEAGGKKQESGDYGVSLFGEEVFAEPEETSLPCEECAHCKKSAQGIHPDLFLLEGGGGARSFHIDAVRSMRQTAYTLPNEAEYKIYVLNAAHTMTVEAQNALLKLLEEPPDYVRIILTAPNRRQLLPTVISRAASLTLGELSGENIDAEHEALIAAAAQKLAAALLAPKTPYAMLEATAPFEGEKELLRETLPALKRELHGALVKNHTMAERVLKLIDGIADLEYTLERNANLNLTITQLAYLGVRK